MNSIAQIDYGTNVLSGLLTRYNRMSNEDYERIYKEAQDYRPKKSINKPLKKIVTIVK